MSETHSDHSVRSPGTSSPLAPLSGIELPERRLRRRRGVRRVLAGSKQRLPRAFEGVLLVSLVSFVLAGFAMAPAFAQHSTTSRGVGVTPAMVPGPSPTVPPEYVNVTTTSLFTFVPNSFTVTPGAVVHLVVTQAATFAHTFLLSPTVNFSFPTSDTTAQLFAYFNAHAPLVNLSLGPTVGDQATATFTAPAAGTYEFVCVVEGHFASGMHGVMTAGTTSAGAPALLPWTLILVGIVVVAAAAGVAVVVLRRRKTPPVPPPDRA